MALLNKKLKSILFILVAVVAVILVCFAFVGCAEIDIPSGGGNTDITTPGNTDDNTDDDNNTGDDDDDDNKPSEPIYTEGLDYEKIKEGEFVVGYSVVGIGDAKDTKIVIPAEYEEKPVTQIAAKAFEDCYKLTEIILPDTITAIESNAFDGCERLEWTEYGNCRYLGTSDNPHFALIREAAPDITSCGVHKDTAIIAGNAFRSWRRDFDRVDYSGTVEDWCKITFNSYDSNPLTYANNLYLNNKLVTNLVIPTTLTDIPKYVFYGLSASGVTFPSSLKTIGNMAFKTSGIARVIISGSIENIGFEAFAKCPELKTVTIKGADGLNINSYAFQSCPLLNTVSIQAENAKLLTAAFEECANLTTVTLKGDNIDMWSSVFSKCESLKTVTLNGDGMTIGDYAFYKCPELETFNMNGIPAKIKSGAFVNELRSIKFSGTVLQWHAIEKHYYWMGYDSYVNPRAIIVECSDGKVTERGR